VRRQRIRAGQKLVLLILLVVAAAAPLTACSAEAEHQPSAELPPASSSSAEPTPELPPLGPKDFPVPDEARTQDEAGAEAYLRYFVGLLNRQQAIPSGQALRALSQDCQECQAIAQRLDQAATNRWRLEGGALHIVGEPGISVVGSEARLSFFARTEAGRVYGSDGTELTDEAITEQRRISSSLTLKWSRDRRAWVPTGLSVG
jgi:hypothetical protein